ncbi:MAG: PilZ domain-containing protein [Planctomycetota bacterium]|nr:PilZ domain-containing protein [Planctomycetota bacterium]
MNAASQAERRKHPRMVLVKACKIRDRRTAMFSPAQTSDYSEGGALLHIERARPFSLGDEIDLAVAWEDGRVLSGSTMARAIVRRVTIVSPTRQQVALEFAAAEAAGEPLSAAIAA